MNPRTLRRPGLAAGALVVSAVALAFAQPTSRSPLAPPPNGPRHVDPSFHAALVGATVHVDPATTVEGGTVVVRDGRIEAVLPAGEAPPSGAAVRDCEGKHVYAGFIEPYLEVETPRPDPEAPGTHWNARVTPQRWALDRGGKGIDEKTGRALREMGFAAAAISPKGGIFAGRAAVVSLAPAESPSAGPAAVYEARAYQSVSFQTDNPFAQDQPDAVRWSSYPNSQMGAIALIRQTLSDAAWQEGARKGGAFPGAEDAVDALARGEGTAADGPAGLVLFNADDELEFLRAAKVADEFGRRAAVLGSGLEFRRLEAIEATGLPVVLPLNYPKAPKVGTVGEQEAVELTTLMNWEQSPTNPRRLEAAGVKAALTTSKIPEKRGGRKAFAERLDAAIKHGLSAEAALAMLTTRPAEILGVSDRLGTVARGKVANLVVADGPLFTARPDEGESKPGSEGYVKRGRIRDVWIDGRRHEVKPEGAGERLKGHWELTFAPAPPAAPPAAAAAPPMAIAFDIDEEGTLTISETTPPPAPAAAPGTPPKTEKVKAKGVRLEGDRLSFTFDHGAFGEPGVYVATATLEQGRDGVPVMHGDLVCAGGGRMTWTARRTSEEPVRDGKQEPKPDEAKDEDAKEKETPKTAEADRIAAIPEALPTPAGPYGRVAGEEQATRTIIRNATVWTCGPGDRGVIEGGEIEIADGKIVYVGASRGASGGAGGGDASTRVIDATGKFVAPGIIDCHSHTGISKGVNESGQAVTAEVRIADVTDPDDVSWYRQLAGGVTCVNTLHGSANAIGGQSQVHKIRWGAAHPDDLHLEGAPTGIKFALGENPRQANWGDRQVVRYPQTRMGVETLIRDRFVAAKEYGGRSDGVTEWRSDGAKASSPSASLRHSVTPSLPSRRDLELEAIAEILAGDRLVHCHSYRQDEILALCRIAEEFGFRIGTFQHNLEGYKVADTIRETAGGASLFSDWWAYKAEVQDAIPFAGPIMHDRGVVVSYNSDSDELARRMNVEAGKVSKYAALGGGEPIPPHRAFEFVTINPAKQLGIADRVGSIEAGKDADVAIWSGTPTSSLSRCEATFVDGRMLFSLADDRAMRESISKERARLIQAVLAAEAGGKAGAGRRGKGKDGEPDAEGADKEAAPTGDSVAVEAEVALGDARRAGRRLMLLEATHRGAELRREHHLHMLRRGLNPRWSRSGDCGCEAWMEGY